MRFPKRWLPGRTRAASSHYLPMPAAPHLRTALLGELACFANAAVYSLDRWREISAYAPQLLAGEPAHLAQFAEYVFHSVVDIQSVDTAVFALTRIGEPPIAEAQRDLFWRAFRVPVYELLVDPECGLLAGECEAHEGWHVRHPQLRFDLQTGRIVYQKHGSAASPMASGLTADGLDGICACGDAAPFLRNVQKVQAKQARARAARA